MAAHLRMAGFRRSVDGEGLPGAGRGRRWPGRSRGGGIAGMRSERGVSLRMIKDIMICRKQSGDPTESSTLARPTSRIGPSPAVGAAPRMAHRESVAPFHRSCARHCL